MTDDKEDKIKITFAPGALDEFDGTQEELDEFIAELEQMANDGSLLEKAEPYKLDPDDMSDRELQALNEMLEDLSHLDEDVVEEMSDEELVGLFFEKLTGESKNRKLN